MLAYQTPLGFEIDDRVMIVSLVVLFVILLATARRMRRKRKQREEDERLYRARQASRPTYRIPPVDMRGTPSAPPIHTASKVPSVTYRNTRSTQTRRPQEDTSFVILNPGNPASPLWPGHATYTTPSSDCNPSSGHGGSHGSSHSDHSGGYSGGYDSGGSSSGGDSGGGGGGGGE